MDKKKTNIFFPVFWSAMTVIRFVAYCLDFKYEAGFSWTFILESLLVMAFFAVAIGYWVRYIRDKKGENKDDRRN